MKLVTQSEALAKSFGGEEGIRILAKAGFDAVDWSFFVKRNNISYNMSLPIWRAIFLPCPKKPYSAGFAAMQ